MRTSAQHTGAGGQLQVVGNAPACAQFQPGVRLARVSAESIEITTGGGARQTVRLTERGSVGGAPGSSPLPAGIAQLPQLQPSSFTENNTDAPDSGPRPSPIGLPAGFQVQPVPSQ